MKNLINISSFKTSCHRQEQTILLLELTFSRLICTQIQIRLSLLVWKKSTQKIYDSYNMQYNFNKNRKKIALVKPASMVVFAGYYMKQNKISRENARNTCVKQHLWAYLSTSSTSLYSLHAGPMHHAHKTVTKPRPFLYDLAIDLLE